MYSRSGRTGLPPDSYPLPTSTHHWYSPSASLTLPLVITDAPSGTLGISDALRDAPLLSARGLTSRLQYSILPERSGEKQPPAGKTRLSANRRRSSCRSNRWETGASPAIITPTFSRFRRQLMTGTTYANPSRPTCQMTGCSSSRRRRDPLPHTGVATNKRPVAADDRTIYYRPERYKSALCSACIPHRSLYDWCSGTGRVGRVPIHHATTRTRRSGPASRTPFPV